MLGWFRALMPKEEKFFVLFGQHSEILMQGAVQLDRLLAGGETIGEACETIIALELAADDVTREVMQAVRRSFITPFDRADIQTLIQSMDDAIDRMNSVVKTVRLFGVTSFDPEMQAIGRVVMDASVFLAEAVPLLARPGANVTRLVALTERIVEAEERVDELHDEGLKALYATHGQTDPMQFFIGRELYEALERVMDRFEDVANAISAIVIESV